MLEIVNNTLVFSFPEVHPDAKLTITLHRTVRIPDDGKAYDLPPSLGSFPVVHVDDYKDKVDPKWVGRGGVMVPLYQSEAMWLGFSPAYSSEHGHCYPFAVKVATGKCSAITGKKWSKKLRKDDYAVCPEQKWIDGYVVDGNMVRQFVAAPLGLGVTAEEQITGKAEFGGLQIEVIPMDPEKFAKRWPKRPPAVTLQRRSVLRGFGGGLLGSSGVPGVYSAVPISEGSVAANYSCDSVKSLSLQEAMEKRPEFYSPQLNSDSLDLDMSRGVEKCVAKLDMGLAPGGKMVQQVFKDPYGISDWSTTAKSRCFVHMANSLGWEQVTGARPPSAPLTAAVYARYNMPWFHYYEEGVASQQGTQATNGLKSAAQFTAQTGIPVLPENQSVATPKVLVVPSTIKKKAVRDGVWK